MTWTVDLATGKASWIERAACLDEPAGIFYPTPHETRRERSDREFAAKAICASCPVRDDCLGYALRMNEDLGVGAA